MTKRKRPKGPMTAAEHLAWLKESGEYDGMMQRLQRQEAELQAKVAERKRAEAPLVAELNAAGFAVESAWDFVNTSDSYVGALPILVDHLQRPYPARILEGIARALAVREAKFAWEVLTRLYRDATERDAKDGLAVAISVVADRELIDDVIALVRDPRHGQSRVLLLSALRRSKDPKARAALMDLASDPDLAKEIQFILRPRKRRGK